MSPPLWLRLTAKHRRVGKKIRRRHSYWEKRGRKKGRERKREGWSTSPHRPRRKKGESSREKGTTKKDISLTSKEKRGKEEEGHFAVDPVWNMRRRGKN